MTRMEEVMKPTRERNHLTAGGEPSTSEPEVEQRFRRSARPRWPRGRRLREASGAPEAAGSSGAGSRRARARPGLARRGRRAALHRAARRAGGRGGDFCGDEGEEEELGKTRPVGSGCPQRDSHHWEDRCGGTDVHHDDRESCGD